MLKADAVLILNDSREREIMPADGQCFTMDELFDYMESEEITTTKTHDNKTMIIDVGAWMDAGKPKNVRASLYVLNQAKGEGVRGKAIIIYNEKLIEGLFTAPRLHDEDPNIQIDRNLYDQY
jgi:dTDP-glucose pyrophosphorylase